MDIYYDVHKRLKAILELKNRGYLKSSGKKKEIGESNNEFKAFSCQERYDRYRNNGYRKS